MIHARLLLMILALLAFACAAFGVASRFNLIAVGLFCWALSLILIV
jgi:hypothetical protein